MKIVILTSGPRGAGKTTYTELVQKIHPEVKYMSRDKILIELFGTTSPGRYSGGHIYAQELFMKRLKEVLREEGDSKIIIDFWNGFSRERQFLVNQFREYGADCVICWQFFLPVETCLDWFFKKSDSKGYSRSGVENDYSLYYRTAENIEKDGFDAIYRIDPLQLTIPGFPLI